MKKDLKTRFTPFVKFKCQGMLDLSKDKFIYTFDKDSKLSYCFIDCAGKLKVIQKDAWDMLDLLSEVSIYEAIPELIPDGMRYNKELDKLVPDVISASDEDCSGIKDELEKVMDYADKKENNPIEPNHYTEMKISPLEYIEANQGDFTWCIANVIKYVSRHKRKNGIEDLKKAQWYLNHEINRLEIIEGMTNAK